MAGSECDLEQFFLPNGLKFARYRDMNAVTKDNQNPRPRILFVDDSRLMRKCAQQILGPKFDLTVAESAEDAWDLLNSDEQIQVLFTDLHMPGKTGYELLRQVRSSNSPRLSDMPVVLITGSEDKETERTHALTLGATDFITKPFQASELNARATAYADSEQSRQRLRLLEQKHHLDPETGLGNRSYCEQRLIQAMSFAARHDQPVSLMHLRLEGLGRLLEELGEPHASRALDKIGRTLAQRVRSEDTAFRTGEESFSFILPATDAAGAKTLQDRFLPDLAGMGLDSNVEGLDVKHRFIVQEPGLDGCIDAGRILADGLSGKGDAGAVEPAEPAEPAQPARPATPREEIRPPDLEEALAMIERGETDRLRPFLPQIRERLQPLIRLLTGGSTETSKDARDDYFWKID